MKTTKKGFTLIELIVVIAIIGVLAAILVPSMLGYVKKSKIQSANSAAATMLKSANSALEEIDEDGDTVDDGWYGTATSSEKGTADDSGKLLEYMAFYSDDVNSSDWCVYVKDNVALVAGAKSGSYYGSAPAVYTNKNYNGGKKTIAGNEITLDKPTTCKTAAINAGKVYNANHTAGDVPTT